MMECPRRARRCTRPASWPPRNPQYDGTSAAPCPSPGACRIPAELVKIDPKGHRRGPVSARYARQAAGQTPQRWWRTASTPGAADINTASPSLFAAGGAPERHHGEKRGGLPGRRTARLPPAPRSKGAQVGTQAAFQQCRLPPRAGEQERAGQHRRPPGELRRRQSVAGARAIPGGREGGAHRRPAAHQGPTARPPAHRRGRATLQDITAELLKPGRDVRDELPEAHPAHRRAGDEGSPSPAWELTGTVRNVIDFGVFVDIGVHQTAWCISPRWRKVYPPPLRGGVRGRHRQGGAGRGREKSASASACGRRNKQKPSGSGAAGGLSFYYASFSARYGLLKMPLALAWDGRGDAAAVADDEQAPCGASPDAHPAPPHVVELHLHAVQQRVVAGGTRRDLCPGRRCVSMMPSRIRLGISRLRVAGRGGQGGGHEALFDALGGGAGPGRIAGTAGR